MRSRSGTRLMPSVMQRDIEWHFNPPGASHQGGVWERIIRSIRKIFMATIGSRSLNDESLLSFLVEVENVLNSRPITKLSDDPQDPMPLTPSMLLMGKTDSSCPLGTFVNADGYRKSWKLVQHLAEQFWSQWLKQYLPLLQTRQKWLHPKRNFSVGDLVLVVDESTKRCYWPKGLIKETFPDSSGVVQRVRVDTASSSMVRDIRKLCLLEARE
ncbi:uncharacterized protein LOC144749863 [Ciona intestinalis]